jgi:hypothetical protein
MSKFKVGDIVVANDLSNKEYSYANKDNLFVGKVVKVYENYFDAEVVDITLIHIKRGIIMKDLDYDYFDLKDEEKKTMNTKEAVVYLMYNPDKKLLIVKNGDGECIRNLNHVIYMKFGNVKFSDGSAFAIYLKNDLREYEVVKDRKLKEMSYGEAYYILANNDEIFAWDVISCVTGLSWARAPKIITKKEYKGLWTVKGHYED